MFYKNTFSAMIEDKRRLAKSYVYLKIATLYNQIAQHFEARECHKSKGRILLHSNM